MPPKRMTANPTKPARYRPGKAIGQAASSSEEEEEEQESDSQASNSTTTKPPDTASKPSSKPTTQPQPPASSFPSKAKQQEQHHPKVAATLSTLDLAARNAQRAAVHRTQAARDRADQDRMERDAGFVTESDHDSDDELTGPAAKHSSAGQATRSGSSSEEEEEEESGSEDSSSSSDDSTPQLRRPVFIPKNRRGAPPPDPAAEAAAQAARDAERRQAEADALVRERLRVEAEERAAGRREWDDDEAEGPEEEAVDDTDGLDVELEHARWVERELRRVKRGREALERREGEIAEVERRRGMSEGEREREDLEFVEGQRRERAEGRGRMAFMGRYRHRGAFFGDEEGEGELKRRDLMGARFVDQAEGVRETLPGYLLERDLTKVGRKGRTRYKDMRSEDTGGYGEYLRRRGGGGMGGEKGAMRDVDERFLPDAPSGKGAVGGTGANASAVGEKRKQFAPDMGQEMKRPRVD